MPQLSLKPSFFLTTTKSILHLDLPWQWQVHLISLFLYCFYSDNLHLVDAQDNFSDRYFFLVHHTITEMCMLAPQMGKRCLFFFLMQQYSSTLNSSPMLQVLGTFLLSSISFPSNGFSFWDGQTRVNYKPYYLPTLSVTFQHLYKGKWLLPAFGSTSVWLLLFLRAILSRGSWLHPIHEATFPLIM